jgi:haloalkane dehalogenase
MHPNVPQNLYPFESHYLDRNGLKYHYVDEGAGDPVVMVHGNPSWSFLYRNVILALRGQYRTLAPDHIGCGFSEKPDDSRYAYRLERRIDDLEALLEHLGIVRDVTLVVHDWGGMIGLGWAARHPERLRRLVVLNTSGFPLPPTKPLPWTLWLCRNTPIGAFLVRGFNAFSFGATYMAVNRRPLTPEVSRAFRAPYDSWANRIATLRFVQDIPLKPGDPGYEIVAGVERSLENYRKIPVMICWGLRDFVFDRHFLEKWEQHLPEAEVHRYEDAGHYVLEDAGEEIIPLIQSFLSKHPLSSERTGNG